MTMPVPKWAEEQTAKLGEYLSTDADMSFDVRNLNRIENYSTFFGEWEIRENDIVVHLFPRKGKEDQWSEGQYIPKCRACHYDLAVEDIKAKKPCPRCGKTGLMYIPGRQETAAEDAEFPSSIMALVKDAADSVWTENVAMEKIPELGAIAVQFQGANLAPQVLASMLEGFFDHLDSDLES